MKVERKIHPNCSEWDSEVGIDEYDAEVDDAAYQEAISEIKKEAVKVEDWDG